MGYCWNWWSGMPDYLLLTRSIGWSVNLWMGSIVLSGIIGLLLSYLLLPPLAGEKETDSTMTKQE